VVGAVRTQLRSVLLDFPCGACPMERVPLRVMTRGVEDTRWHRASTLLQILHDSYLGVRCRDLALLSLRYLTEPAAQQQCPKLMCVWASDDLYRGPGLAGFPPPLGEDTFTRALLVGGMSVFAVLHLLRICVGAVVFGDHRGQTLLLADRTTGPSGKDFLLSMLSSVGSPGCVVSLRALDPSSRLGFAHGGVAESYSDSVLNVRVIHGPPLSRRPLSDVHFAFCLPRYSGRANGPVGGHERLLAVARVRELGLWARSALPPLPSRWGECLMVE